MVGRRAVDEDADGIRAVLDALATLPAEQRAALVLVDMEGYPVAEVAVMLDCAVGTVKSRCSRGRSRLAVVLGGLGVIDADDDEDHPDPGNPPGAASVRPSNTPRGPPASS